ncbi:hypothetical protein EMPG_10145 [Blastomyces silverae]|uniref:Uncharacterized protein n=1 Tax=Blastomyces silverae TaxID=2060906 RepID=A0A0H1B4W4_9EURO|nr:hypothetical protein EMPG_10145 [Blastomyces silverae]
MEDEPEGPGYPLRLLFDTAGVDQAPTSLGGFRSCHQARMIKSRLGNCGYSYVQATPVAFL